MNKCIKSMMLAAALSIPMTAALADGGNMAIPSTDVKTVAVQSETIKTPRSGWYIGSALGFDRLRVSHGVYSYHKDKYINCCTIRDNQNTAVGLVYW